MKDFVIDKKTIAKNTFFLYSRMIFILIVNFYAVRILLQIIGIQDYGTFTIAMGIVMLFSVLCNAIGRTTQRFLCIAIVQDEKKAGTEVFSICLTFFLVATVFLVILAETIGLYFFKHKLQIPVAKYSTALFVYQMSILCIIFQTLTIPFSSSVIAKERMDFFAKIGLLEALLKLGTVLLLQYCCFRNALIAYSILMVISFGIIFGCYFIYCIKNFIFCRFIKRMNITVVKEIFYFSSWSLLGATANLAKTQGINVLLNIFHGVCFNSTWGITSQVSGGVNSFLNGFQQAFNPEILKSQKNKDKESFWNLLFSSSKYSYLLVWLICSPLILHLSYVLHLWLGKDHCPPQIESFIIFALVFNMFESLSGPLWTAVESIGHIMCYQLAISGIMIGGVIVCYLLFSVWNLPAYTAMLTNAIFNMFCFIFRLIYLKMKIRLCIADFCRKVLLPAGFVTFLSICIILFLKLCFIHTTISTFLFSCSFLTVANLLLYYIFAISKEEKTKLFALLQQKMGKD